MIDFFFFCFVNDLVSLTKDCIMKTYEGVEV